MAMVLQTPFELLDKIGLHLGYSEWLEIDQNRINKFAEATGDYQWIHVDENKAATGPFGKCIAHGYLTLSLVYWFLPQIIDVRGTKMDINYGTNKVRFPAAVPVGAKVRGGAEVIEVEEIKGCVQSTVRVTIEIKDCERPALVTDTISRYVPE